ncbi:MAG TPA: two-component system response regulator [Deltaproteobacteria bacterium]|nr:two-component system response regulator [Deltaproteobacteria bacterium]
MNENTVEVILVEDNPADAEMTLAALSEHNFANKVKLLKDGAEAIDYIMNNVDCIAGQTDKCCPKVILLDLKLPKIDGLEVLRRIRSSEHTKSVPVVVLTSSNEEKDRIESYKLGVNSYIVKPVNFDDFARSVAEIGCYWLLMNKPPY